jgi:alpha-beta hydrolase superfamily lysophospholipase
MSQSPVSGTPASTESIGSGSGDRTLEPQSSQSPPSKTVQAGTAELSKPADGKESSAPKAAGKGGSGKKAQTLRKKRRGNAPCLAWVDPDVPVKAALLCVHGLGLHNGTYEDFGKRMARLGIATYAIDVRGFGSWMEARGRERVDFDGCLSDVKATLDVIHRAHPGLPVFVLGESMGGAIALRAAALYPDLVDGLISSVPAGDRFQQKRTALKVALHLLDGPNKQFNVGQGVIEQATQKQELREAWEKDPLARMNLSPNELIQFQSFMNQNHESAKKIKTLPVLIVQGCKDRLVRPEGTVELYNKLATPDRQLELIHNAEHLVFEENQFTDADIDLVHVWLDKHLKRQPESQGTESTANKNAG